VAIVGLLVLVLVGATVWLVTSTGRQVSARDVAWLAGTPSPPPDEADVFARYLARHRRHRRVGALVGVLVAVFVGVRWYGSITFGIGVGSPLADVLFCGLTGLLAGALSAESFRLSEPPSPITAASLVERGAVARSDLTRWARGLTLTSMLAAVGIAVTGGGLAPLWVAASGLALVLLAEATRRAIAERRRPLLSDRAHRADLRMRSFATTSVAWLQLAAAVLIAGWVMSTAADTRSDLVEVVRGVAVTGCLVLTVVMLHRASTRPPRRWVPPPT
jgi:hypothetical protein